MKSIINHIVFIDQTSQFSHHQVFNSAIVDIMIDVFQTQNVSCHGITSNHHKMYDLMAHENRDLVTFIPIHYPKSPSNLFLKIILYPIKEWIRFLNFKRIFKYHNTKEDVILLSITTFTSFYVFRWLASRSKAQIFSVLHGDLDFLYKAENLNQKLNAWVHQKILNFKKQRNFKYILLNKIAKHHLIVDSLLTEDEILDIYHPIVSEFNGKPNTKLQNPILIGHIGSMELGRKNSHYIYALADNLKNETHVKFMTIGLITPHIIPYKNESVMEISGNKAEDKPFYLPRKDYISNLLKLDYIVFFYPKDEYVMRASGAVSDFIDFLKPIIALKHPLFEYFESQVGSIGFLCEDLDEIQYLISDLATHQEKYLELRHTQIENIRKLKERSSKSQINMELREMLQAKGWEDVFSNH